MTENGNRYALAALKQRRAAIDGEMRECERRVRYLRETLGHLDATLSLFDPEGNPKTIKAKRPYRRVKLFSGGQLGRTVLSVLREGARPMTTAEVIEAVVVELNYGADAAVGMKGRVRGSLLYQWKVRGLLTKDGERETARWSIAR